MLTSVLSLGLLSLIPFVTAQASYTYHGCISGFTSGTAAASGAASVAACNTACSATKYFYYRAAATTPCQCSDTDPYRYSAAEVTFVNSQDSGGTCPSTAVQVYMRQTTFVFGGCYASSTPAGALIISRAGSLAIVADYCRSTRTIVISLDPNTRTYNGFCGNVGTNVPSSPQVCSEGTVQRYYTHSAIAAASQLARRNARLSRRKVQGPNYCPGSLTACNVQGAIDSYECLDIRSELESCGGCIHGTYGSNNATRSGQDCTTMKGARRRSVTCARGRCVAMSCIKGFILVGGECIPSR